LGSIRFGSFRVRVYTRSIRVRVSLDSIQVVSNFGSLQFRVGSVLGQFNFEFQVKIGSTLSHVGSDSISGCSVRIVWFGSLLLGLVMRFNREAVLIPDLQDGIGYAAFLDGLLTGR